MIKYKTINVYWFNALDHEVKFYNDNLDDSSFMGSISGNTPIKLSVDVREDCDLVIKQVSKDKILVSSVNMNVLEEDVVEVG